MRALLVLVLLARAAHADRTPEVGKALAAVRSLRAQTAALDKAIYDATRACTGDAIACWSRAATDACATVTDKAACAAVADVIAVNLRGATALVDEPTRMRLVRGTTDYHAALVVELRKRYAYLAAELALFGATDEAAAIAELCATRDHAIHACEPGDAACVPSLPWSRCVAALVWFVGTTP